MDPAKLFDVVGWIAIPGWLLLVFLPRWRWTPLATACVLPAILAAIYLVLLASTWGKGEGSFTSLAGVRGLFQLDEALLAGWIHYLAFDLFVGSWEVRDAQRLGIGHGWVLPCLALTFLLGPVGMLAWWVLRSVLAREVFRGEIAAQQR